MSERMSRPWCVVNASVTEAANDTKGGNQGEDRVLQLKVSQEETKAARGRCVARLGGQCGLRLQAQASGESHPRQGRRMRH